MGDLKTIAIYLPQYHKVKENDEWWGENYTEWTAVKAANRLYEEHEQPRVPLHKNYYDLLNKETMEWQADLAKRYSVYGFCFFHYYFKDGRKILEKPAENLLKWKEISMNFCFSWANASWVRTWSKVSGGSMASKFEKYHEGETVLLEQQYGSRKEWKDHFEYLLKFFKDKRYIKINGRPIFLFHEPEIINCLGEMVAYWRELAKENGFPDIYLIGVITNIYQEYPMLDAVYAHEPRFLFRDYIQYSDESKRDICGRYNLYKEACRWSYMRRYSQRQKLYFSAFAGFDSTPRHDIRGAIVDKVTPDAFENSFRMICQRSLSQNNEFVFINAWNEWGECNYLEPDTKNGFSFLEAVRKVMGEIEGDKVFPLCNDEKYDVFFQVIKEHAFQRDKFKEYYLLFDQWMYLLENGNGLLSYFKKHNYWNGAIYGFGSLGRHVINQLTGKVDIRYIIDQKIDVSNFYLPFYKMTDDLPETDVIIVTVINEYEKIKSCLRKKFKGKIISLVEVVKECLNDGE